MGIPKYYIRPLHEHASCPKYARQTDRAMMVKGFLERQGLSFDGKEFSVSGIRAGFIEASKFQDSQLIRGEGLAGLVQGGIERASFGLSGQRS